MLEQMIIMQIVKMQKINATESKLHPMKGTREDLVVEISINIVDSVNFVNEGTLNV